MVGQKTGSKSAIGCPYTYIYVPILCFLIRFTSCPLPPRPRFVVFCTQQSEPLFFLSFLFFVRVLVFSLAADSVYVSQQKHHAFFIFFSSVPCTSLMYSLEQENVVIGISPRVSPMGSLCIGFCTPSRYSFVAQTKFFYKIRVHACVKLKKIGIAMLLRSSCRYNGKLD